MGRTKPRKKKKGKDKAGPSGGEKKQAPSWEKQLNEALTILSSWADVADSELVTVCEQLVFILRTMP